MLRQKPTIEGPIAPGATGALPRSTLQASPAPEPGARTCNATGPALSLATPASGHAGPSESSAAHAFLSRFRKPVAEIEAKIEELRQVANDDGAVPIGEELTRLEFKAEKALGDLYQALTPWQKTQVARHPQRPHFSDYAKGLFTEFTPMAGDRVFGEDAAIVGGFGRFRGRAVCIIGQEKGWDTESRVRHNFGMAKPEGYRKAARLMGLAEQFGLPVISMVDTAGAFPGIEAEERGQAEAIARSTEACLALGAPNVAVVIGEGGSGGAVAIATANRVIMLEHSIYTVASPEASAAILWKSSGRAEDAATNMKITAQDLLRFGIIDAIIPEPAGGAHRDPHAAIAATGDAVASALDAFNGMDAASVRDQRAARFLAIGRRP